MLNSDYYKKNRKLLLDNLSNNSLALIYSGKEIQKSLDEDYNFYVNNNYLYLTGLNEPNGVLLLYKNSFGKTEEFLFIPEADHFKEKWVGYKYSRNEAKEISGLNEVLYLKDLDDFISNRIDKDSKIYKDLSLADFNSFSFPNENDLTILDISDILFKQRLIKSEEEIEELKNAIDISAIALKEVVKSIKPGIKEFELAALFEYLVKKNGADSLSFETIAASGKNGPILHYVKNSDILNNDQLILFDLGARKNGYNADISRTYPIDGKFKGLEEKFYKALLKTQKEIIKEYKAGVKLVDLQQKTKDFLSQNLLEQNIKLPEGGIDEWYYHSIGHSLGLDTHDGVNRDLVLEDNMVITCEPGVYAREYNIGIRIEDDILINGDNPVNLTEKIPKEIKDIEELMN